LLTSANSFSSFSQLGLLLAVRLWEKELAEANPYFAFKIYQSWEKLEIRVAWTAGDPLKQKRGKAP
jgi:hypothetical protein